MSDGDRGAPADGRLQCRGQWSALTLGIGVFAGHGPLLCALEIGLQGAGSPFAMFASDLQNSELAGLCSLDRNLDLPRSSNGIYQCGQRIALSAFVAGLFDAVGW